MEEVEEYDEEDEDELSGRKEDVESNISGERDVSRLCCFVLRCTKREEEQQQQHGGAVIGLA